MKWEFTNSARAEMWIWDPSGDGSFRYKLQRGKFNNNFGKWRLISSVSESIEVESLEQGKQLAEKHYSEYKQDRKG